MRVDNGDGSVLPACGYPGNPGLIIRWRSRQIARLTCLILEVENGFSFSSLRSNSRSPLLALLGKAGRDTVNANSPSLGSYNYKIVMATNPAAT